MRRPTVSAIVCTIMSLAASVPAWSQGELRMREEQVSESTTPPRWELSLGGEVGAPFGFVKVGEFDRSGTKLRLHNDLGVDTFETAELGVAYHFTPRDVVRARLAHTFLYGSHTVLEPVAFNGALLASGPGTEIKSRPIFARGSVMYEHEFVHTARGSTFAFGSGFTYVYLHYKLESGLAPETVGHETGEDFYKQELPVPLVAIRGEYPITPRLHLLGAVDGGFLPKVDSLRNEGGTVKLAQGHADVFAGLRYSFTPQLAVDGGYRYTYFSQHETSSEDDNKILFLGHAFAFGLTYAF